MDARNIYKKVTDKPLGRIYNKIKNTLLRIRFKYQTTMFLLKYKYVLKIVEGAEGIKIYQKVIIDGFGKVKIGKNVSFGLVASPNYYGHYTFISLRYPFSELVIGDDCIFNNNNSLVVVKKISFGNKCMSGQNTEYMDSDFHSIDPVLRHENNDLNTDEGNYIIINDNVMIGANVICGTNTIIGKNSVVGLGSILSRKDYPENTVIVGNPARAVKIIQ